MLAHRETWTLASASKTFYGKLAVDFLTCDQLLIPNCSMRIRLTRNKSEYLLQSVVANAMTTYTTFEGKRKGNNYYYGGGYLYLKRLETGEKLYLKCQDRTCRATAEVRDNLLVHKKSHTHPQPTYEFIEDLKRLACVKEDAERTIDRPSCSTIYDAAVIWSETSSTGRAKATRRRQRGLNAMRQRRCSQRKSGFSAYGARQNLHNATKLSLKKVDDFLQGKNSYTKFFIPQRRSYTRLFTLASDINDIWCMDVAYVDKNAMPNDGVKILLVCRCLVTLLEWNHSSD